MRFQMSVIKPYSEEFINMEDNSTFLNKFWIWDLAVFHKPYVNDKGFIEHFKVFLF